MDSPPAKSMLQTMRFRLYGSHSRHPLMMLDNIPLQATGLLLSVAKPSSA